MRHSDILVKLMIAGPCGGQSFVGVRLLEEARWDMGYGGQRARQIK